MVILKSPNRFLAKVEADHALKSFKYEERILQTILKKYGYSRDYAWKKSDMDKLQGLVNKERKHLANLVWICFDKHRVERNAKKRRPVGAVAAFSDHAKHAELKMRIHKLITLITSLESSSQRALETIDKIRKQENRLGDSN